MGMAIYWSDPEFDGWGLNGVAVESKSRGSGLVKEEGGGGFAFRFESCEPSAIIAMSNLSQGCLLLAS